MVLIRSSYNWLFSSTVHQHDLLMTGSSVMGWMQEGYWQAFLTGWPCWMRGVDWKLAEMSELSLPQMPRCQTEGPLSTAEFYWGSLSSDSSQTHRLGLCPRICVGWYLTVPWVGTGACWWLLPKQKSDATASRRSGQVAVHFKVTASVVRVQRFTGASRYFVTKIHIDTADPMYCDSHETICTGIFEKD